MNPQNLARAIDHTLLKADASKEQIEDTRQLIRNLKANLTNNIVIKENTAEMRYGDSYKVQFAREDGIWKIVDAD